MTDSNLKKKKLAFINDVLQPWEELNGLLTRPCFSQHDLSAFTRHAIAIASALSHFPEKYAQPRLKGEHSVVNDIADKAKHGKLRDSKRNNSLSTESIFLLQDNKLKFLRNAIIVEHATYGYADFLELMRPSMAVHLKELGIDRALAIQECVTSEFHDEARLEWDRSLCVQPVTVKLKVVRKIDSQYVCVEDGFQVNALFTDPQSKA